MIKKCLADRLELGGGADAADAMFKGFIQPLHDVNEVFFHVLNVFVFVKISLLVGNLIVEECDVFEQVGVGDSFRGGSVKGVADLTEYPWVSDGSSTDHQSVGLGLLDHSKSCGGVDDVSIGDDWAVHVFDGLADGGCMDRRLVALFHSASVNGELVDFVVVEEFQ